MLSSTLKQSPNLGGSDIDYKISENHQLEYLKEISIRSRTIFVTIFIVYLHNLYLHSILKSKDGGRVGNYHGN